MKEIIAKVQISPEVSIKDALKKIDATGMAILFVCDGSGCLIGSLTDGDIRRKILKGGGLHEQVACCFNRHPVFLLQNKYTTQDVRELMLEKTIDVIPVITEGRKIIDVLFWKDIFQEDTVTYKKIDIPVVIMAGGKGERLDPFTKILPKPLIPIGERPIAEVIIDKFNQYGVNKFYITLNYKGVMIKNYFDSIEKEYEIDYIWEKGFCGTAGSLALLPSTVGNIFIVSNCDIIVDIDFSDLVRFHYESNNILTVVGSIQHYKIPYGVINYERAGKIKNIQEKPEFDMTVNTGMYVLSYDALRYIPRYEHFDMTDLVQVLVGSGENIGVYPVSQKAYGDVGQMEDYRKTLEKLRVF